MAERGQVQEVKGARGQNTGDLKGERRIIENEKLRGTVNGIVEEGRGYNKEG